MKKTNKQTNKIDMLDFQEFKNPWKPVKSFIFKQVNEANKQHSM